ncbi:ATP-binding protein [Streptomyces mexicanus]|uniref:ATP-binding protein n=1 Tax=Streptomyces mexicanus TaxID=178566 RepID=UPI003673682A
MSDVNQQTQQTVVGQPRLHQFAVPLSATRRGARLARLLAAEQLHAWGLPLDPARLIVAELAANAVTHGRVPGRSFRLALAVTVHGVLRIEVTDWRGDVLPRPERDGVGPVESGYGLVLVDASADRWGVCSGPVPCKTVWAELDPVHPSPHVAPEPGSV